MARGRFISDFEADVIRIGHSAGIDNATIARAMGRTKSAIGKYLRRMEEEQTITDLPRSFMADKVAEMLRREGGIR